MFFPFCFFPRCRCPSLSLCGFLFCFFPRYRCPSLPSSGRGGERVNDAKKCTMAERREEERTNLFDAKSDLRCSDREPSRRTHPTAAASATRTSAGCVRGTRPRALPVTRPPLPPHPPNPLLPPSPSPVHSVPCSSPAHIWTGRFLVQFISGKIKKQHEAAAYKDGRGKLFPCPSLEGQE